MDICCDDHFNSVCITLMCCKVLCVCGVLGHGLVVESENIRYPFPSHLLHIVLSCCLWVLMVKFQCFINNETRSRAPLWVTSLFACGIVCMKTTSRFMAAAVC